MRNKKFFLFGSVLLFCFAIGTVMGVIYTRKTAPVPEERGNKAEEESVLSNVTVIQSTPVPVITPKPSAEPVSSFFVCISGEEINIYEMMPDGEMQFLDKTEVQIEQLRQDDYEKLCKGIVVDSLAEAKGLAEDFGS